MEVDNWATIPRTWVLVVGIIGLYVSYNIGLIVYNLYFHPLARFPGPSSRASVYMANYWHIYKGSQTRNMKLLFEEYGDVVRITPDTLAFRTAQAFKDIYGTRVGKHQLRKDPRTYAITGEEKSHIIYSNDADHARMRKLLSHAFSDSALRQQEPIMNNYFNLFVQRLKETINDTGTNTVDMTSWYNFLTFDIIGDMCFGEPFGALKAGDYHFWMKNLFNGIKYGRILIIANFYEPAYTILKLLIRFIPGISKAKDQHENFTRLKTLQRLSAKTDRVDFMSYILRHNDERGMSQDEIMETSGLLIIAGSETTATLLSGATYLLLKNPRVYSKVKEEVRNAFSSGDEITLTSTARLSYLHAVLEEALRVYPPVPFTLLRRTPPEGDIIDGHFVPGNMAVGVHHLSAYHNKESFAEPDAFVPERWLPDPPAQFKNDKRDVLNPFSLGPRNCIGKNLAYNEMRSAMARMLWHFEMELCSDSESWMDQDVYFLWEKPKLNIKLSHRNFDS